MQYLENGFYSLGLGVCRHADTWIKLNVIKVLADHGAKKKSAPYPICDCTAFDCSWTKRLQPRMVSCQNVLLGVKSAAGIYYTKLKLSSLQAWLIHRLASNISCREKQQPDFTSGLCLQYSSSQMKCGPNYILSDALQQTLPSEKLISECPPQSASVTFLFKCIGCHPSS